MGIENLLERESVLSAPELPVLVGCGTDGTSVNVSDQNGMQGKLQAALPWLYWTFIGLNLHARMPFPVISSVTSMRCC